MLVSLLALSLFAGCSSSSDNGAIVKVGLGVVTDISKSRDAGTNAEGNAVLAQAQVDTTIAAVGFDKDGKVVSVTIDVAQVRVAYDADLKATNKNAEFKTKGELGEAYNMKARSPIGKEWDEQIVELEKWMIGKTISEIKAINLTENRPADEDLAALVTITVDYYIAAVEKAWNNAFEISGAHTVGLGTKIDASKSRDLGTNAEGAVITPQAQVDVTISATAFDKDGKVVRTIIDAAQTRVAFDAEGKVTNRNATIKTKAELGEAYNMKARSPIGKEWDEQIVELEKWMAGKTVAEIKAMNLAENRPADEDLAALVTVTVDYYIAAVEKAHTNAR